MNRGRDMDWHIVRLRMSDGRDVIETFATRYGAEVFLALIPALQVAAEAGLADPVWLEVASAMLEPTVAVYQTNRV